MAKSFRIPHSRARKLSSSALRITDEFFNLKEAHLAFACARGPLSPIQRVPRYE